MILRSGDRHVMNMGVAGVEWPKLPSKSPYITAYETKYLIPLLIYLKLYIVMAEMKTKRSAIVVG